MITAAIIGRSSSHYFPISRALTTLHLPTTTAQPILPSCYPQNSFSFSYHLSFRRNYIIDTMTRSSLLAVTTTCTQLFLLIGGIQSFATPFNHNRSNDLTNNKSNNNQKGAAKTEIQSQDTSSLQRYTTTSVGIILSKVALAKAWYIYKCNICLPSLHTPEPTPGPVDLCVNFSSLLTNNGYIEIAPFTSKEMGGLFLSTKKYFAKSIHFCTQTKTCSSQPTKISFTLTLQN